MVNRRIAWLMWRLPEALFILGIFWRDIRVWLWVPSLTVAGLACVVNARRCGRRHCFFTGPLYLVGGLASLLKGLRILLIPWSWILVALLAGTAAAYGIECVQGRYLENAPR